MDNEGSHPLFAGNQDMGPAIDVDLLGKTSNLSVYVEDCVGCDSKRE